jgi:hypothetical protein
MMRPIPSSATTAAPLPIQDYDELTARRVIERLAGLAPAALRMLRDYERKHANRKSVLEAIERLLG